MMFDASILCLFCFFLSFSLIEYVMLSRYFVYIYQYRMF